MQIQLEVPRERYCNTEGALQDSIKGTLEEVLQGVESHVTSLRVNDGKQEEGDSL